MERRLTKLQKDVTNIVADEIEFARVNQYCLVCGQDIEQARCHAMHPIGSEPEF
jgi:hypothetical protein